MTDKRPPKESAISRSILEALKKAGVFAWKNHGNPYSYAGLPDICAVHGGVTYYLETKRPGEVPTPIQAAFHTKLREAGAPVTVVHDKEEALAFLFLKREGGT